MAGIHSLLPVTITLTILSIWIGTGRGFLADSKTLDFPLQLTLEPSQVTKATTENIKLRCIPGISKTVQIEKFSIIRILKQDPNDDTGETWISLVEKKNVFVEDAAIEFVWPVATSGTFGVYHCDAIGFTADANIVSGNTPNIEIKMTGVTANDLLDVLTKSKARLQGQVANNSGEIGELKEQLDLLTEVQRNRSAVIRQRLQASEHAIETVIHRLLFPEIPWPTGHYALLQPDTGCPLALNFFGGHTGFFKLHAESSQSTTGTVASPTTHMAQPAITTSHGQSFVTLRFCMSKTVIDNVPWPKGEYCIHSATGSCPSGFTVGRILVDTEDTNNQDAKGGNYPSYSPSDLRFCCTKTGAHSTPIVLPTEKPFYLYRYKSPCQEVVGMNVEIDYFEIAVEKRSNSHSGWHPYTVMKTNSKRFEMCYYSKK